MDVPQAGQLVLLALVLVTTILAYHLLLGSQTKPGVEKIPPSEPTKGWKTFRVSGVPSDWDEDLLQSFLIDQEDVVGPVVDSLTIDIDGRYSTGTATFQDVPEQLQNGRPWKIPLQRLPEGQPARNRYLVLDDAFLGITPLYGPHPDYHKVDIIAISGLGGHAFGSFKERGGNHMWLRDSLPGDLTHENTHEPIARVMIYGYESSVANSNNFQNLEDLATSFHNSLLALARTPITRPIIFVAHSLGGLIVKQALITLSKSKNEDDLKLVKAVYGIVFFGVPHDGMDITSLIPMVENGPNRFLIESISRINSQILSIQQREFPTALGGEGDSEIICFYETEESRTAQKDKHDNWTMQGPKACLVTKSSATHCRSWEDGPEHTCAIARTHSDMVKFGLQDHEYHKARERLIGLARRALVARHRKQSAGAKFLVPYTENPSFVNRPEVFEKLESQLGLGQQTGAVHVQLRVSLYGLGGVGKTQIALAYVYWLRKQRPDMSVFWVRASNEEWFRQSYVSIAEECDIPGRDNPDADLLALVKRWLEDKFKRRWLMVIDNADDTQLFFPLQQGSMPTPHRSLGYYIPECAHGSILVTTRNKQAGSRLTQGKLPIEVGNMTDHEANQLIRIMLEDNNVPDEEISGLATRLESLPLALAQAASFIHENGITIDDYIVLLDKSDATLVECLSEPFETVGRDSETPHAVTATWIISFEQIKKQNRFAGEVLSLISLLDRQAIPREFIANYWQRERVAESNESCQEVRITKALGTLKAFCFVSEAKDQSLDMHRLVQLVARKWLVMKGKMAEFAQHALKTVSDVYPLGQFETREVCLEYLPHAYAVLRGDSTSSREGTVARARLLHNMTSYFLYEGRWKEAEELEVDAMEITKRVLGDEHPYTLSGMNSLALIHQSQGHWKEAEELQVDMIEIAKRVLGEEHPDTLKSMSNLGSTYYRQGRWKEAEELEVDVMERTKRVLGEEHPDTLTGMNNLALIHQTQGHWKEAEELQVDVMEVAKRVLGEEHPHTLATMSNLASTYQTQGHWKEAEELQVDVMEITKRVLGEEHPHTLTSMGNLALTYQSQGRWKEAEELQIDVMEIRKRLQGDEHADTLTAIGNLALTYQSQGRWKEAEELQVDVMETTKRLQGDEHPDALKSMSNRASTYYRQGRWKEAEELEVDVMERRKRVLGDEHPDTLKSMSNRALIYYRHRQWREAEELQVDVVEITKRVLGDEHPDTLTSMSNLASTYSKQGRWKEAEELEVDVMEIRNRVLGDEHPDTLTSMNNLASTYSEKGRWKEAEELEVDVMEIRNRVLGDEHPDTLTSMNNLASTYSEKGRWKEAEELEVDVIEISKRVLGKEHPHTLTSMSNLASTYQSQGRWKEAEELEVNVMEITKRVLGEEHSDTLKSMSNLASTYQSQGRWKEAEELRVDVMEIRKRLQGDEHPDTLTSMGNLASTYQSQGRWKKAEELEVDVMERTKRVLRDEHPSTLTSMNNLASTYRNQGRWKEAEELEVDVMETRKRALGEEHPHTLTSMSNLASTYRNQGRWKEAEALQVDVMEIRKRLLGDEHPSTLTSMSNLALTYQSQGRWKETEELRVDVIETRKRLQGDEHPDTLATMGNLASTYRNQGRWKEAEELEVDVMETMKRVLGEEHPHTLTSMNNLASTYSKQGRWKEAEELEVDVMETRKRVLGEEHPDTLTSMSNLAVAWKANGRTKDALALLRNCIALRQRVLGTEHPHTTSSVTRLAEWEDTDDSPSRG